MPNVTPLTRGDRRNEKLARLRAVVRPADRAGGRANQPAAASTGANSTFMANPRDGIGRSDLTTKPHDGVSSPPMEGLPGVTWLTKLEIPSIWEQK